MKSSSIRQIPNPNVLYKTFVLICINIIAISCTASTNIIHPKYVNPTGNEFPILGSGTFSFESNINPKNFRILREAGFNISLAMVATKALTIQTLEAAEGSGVKIIVNDPDIKNLNTIPTAVSSYRDKPNVMGYYITDEPKADAFKKWKEYRDLIYEYDSIHIPYINLFPIVDRKRQPADQYESYLRDFIDILDLPMFSYDNYPIIKQNGEIIIKDTFYENLEIAAKVSTDTQIPFWAFCLSTRHLNYPLPTKTHLTFEAFSALAYGAQGISYYNYIAPRHSSIKHFEAPADSLGRKTKLWYIVRDVNQQIQNLSFVFLGAKLIGVWHTGNQIPIGTTRLTELPNPFKNLKSEKEGVLVSHLVNNGHQYLVIVNHDILKSQLISLDKETYVKRIYPDGKVKAHSSSKFKLDPGGYAIFSWD